MARTPLFDFIKRIHRLSMTSDLSGGPPIDEVAGVVAASDASRRRFLAGSLATAGLLGAGGLGYYLQRDRTPSAVTSGSQPAPRKDIKVVIVGGGLSGLSAAHHLKKVGIQARIFEATSRAGGRIFSKENLLGEGLITELGGEFINTNHKDVLSLASELQLKILDKQKIENPNHKKCGYYLGGSERSIQELVRAFQPVARVIERDAKRLKKEEAKVSLELDKLSVSDYFQKIEMEPWLRTLLNLVFTTEMGLESGEQSALLVPSLHPKMHNDLPELLGDSDERFKVQGGNQRIIAKLAASLENQIIYNARLENITPRGDGFRLLIQGKEVDADAVILTVPFSVLRQIDLKVKLPTTLERFIREVGYGTNAKLMAGFKQRIWHEKGYAGEFYSDEGFQLAWDNTVLQSTTQGGITFFTGGKTGASLKDGSVMTQWERLSPGLAKFLPNLNSATNGKLARFHWPSFPYSKGSYACHKPGQYTQFINKHVYMEENGKGNSVHVGNLFFAGEHLSDDFGGYMNGAAQTGRLAAQAIWKRLVQHG